MAYNTAYNMKLKIEDTAMLPIMYYHVIYTLTP